MEEKELKVIIEKAKDAQKMALNTHLKIAYLELETAALRCLIMEQAKKNTVGGIIL